MVSLWDVFCLIYFLYVPRPTLFHWNYHHVLLVIDIGPLVGIIGDSSLAWSWLLLANDMAIHLVSGRHILVRLISNIRVADIWI